MANQNSSNQPFTIERKFRNNARLLLFFSCTWRRTYRRATSTWVIVWLARWSVAARKPTLFRWHTLRWFVDETMKRPTRIRIPPSARPHPHCPSVGIANTTHRRKRVLIELRARLTLQFILDSKQKNFLYHSIIEQINSVIFTRIIMMLSSNLFSRPGLQGIKQLNIRKKRSQWPRLVALADTWHSMRDTQYREIKHPNEWAKAKTSKGSVKNLKTRSN